MGQFQGVLIGDGDLGKHTGVAPDAKLMMLQMTGGNQGDALEALDFFTKMKEKNTDFPLPDVVSKSNSIKFPDSPDWEAFRRSAITNYLYDIIIFNSAGNEAGNSGNIECGEYGFPIPYNIGETANTPPPWNDHNDQNSPEDTDTLHVGSVMTVGSAGKDLQAWHNSSRGPSAWQSIDSTHGDDYSDCQKSISSEFHDYIHDNGEGFSKLLKPDVVGPSSYDPDSLVAPKDSMKSTASNSETDDYAFFANTSQATPHVAGVSALMYELNPDLTSTQISKILQTRSLHVDGTRQTYKDTVRGAGFVDAYEAIKYTLQNYGGTLGDQGETVQLHESYTIQSGDTLEITDGTTFNMNSSDTLLINGTLIVGQNVTGQFGAGSRLEIADGGTIEVNASSSNPTVFEDKSGNRWDGLIIKGSGTLNGLRVRMADYGVQAIGAGVTLTDGELTNNDIGFYADENASGTDSDITLNNILVKYIDNDGIRVSSSDLELHDVTVEAVDGTYGVYVSNTELWEARGSVIENNAVDAGLYVSTGSLVLLWDDGAGEALNRIANNSSHEIITESGYGDFYSQGSGEINSIYDTDDGASDFEFYVWNQDSNSEVGLDYVWWEDEPPAPGHFSGPVSTDNAVYQSTDPTKDSGYESSTKKVDYDDLVVQGSASTPDSPTLEGMDKDNLQTTIDQLQQQLTDEPFDTASPRRLTRLYGMLRAFDPADELGERGETQQIMADWRRRLEEVGEETGGYTSDQRQIIRSTGEPSVYKAMLWAQKSGDLDRSAQLAADYGTYVETPPNRRAYLRARAYERKSAGDYDHALTLIDEYRNTDIQIPEEMKDHANQVYNRFTHSIELLSGGSTNNSETAQVAGKQPEDQKPTEFAIADNYPNPFNPATTIEYAIPEASHVEITVYNIMGRKVATLVNSRKEAGRYSVRFDASNLASGVYIYRIQAGSFSKSRQMVLVK